MRFLTRSRTAVALAVGGTALATVTGAVGGASAATSYSASCSARLLYVELGGSEIPLYDGTDGCGQDDSIIGQVNLDPIPVQADLLYQRTTANSAEAGVAHVYLPLAAASGGQLPDITVDVLTSQATCTDGEPSGSSHVARVDVDGYGSFEAPQDLMLPNPIDLDPIPLKISMNDQVTPPPTTTTTTSTSGDTTTTTTTVTKSLTQTALEISSPDLLDVVVARTHVDCTKTTTTTVTNPPPPPPPSGGDQAGWMNGGGTMVDSPGTTVDPGTKVSHGFVLPCHVGQTPPGGSNLVVNGDFGSFKLTSVGEVHCTMDPRQGDPENPKATFNTMDGQGSGRCNGGDATIRWHFTDEGEPNKADEATLHITGSCTADVVGVLTNGNNQAHPLSDKGSSKATKSQHAG